MCGVEPGRMNKREEFWIERVDDEREVEIGS